MQNVQRRIFAVVITGISFINLVFRRQVHLNNKIKKYKDIHFFLRCLSSSHGHVLKIVAKNNRKKRHNTMIIIHKCNQRGILKSERVLLLINSFSA